MRYFLETATGARNAIVAVAGYDIAPYGNNLVFGLSGTSVHGDSITIWGQTAPGRYVVRNEGWTLNDNADNVIIEHITFMIGDSVQSLNGNGHRVFNNEAHGLQIQQQLTSTSDLVKIVLSHNTLLYGIDSNLDIFNNNPDVRKIDSLFIWRNLFAASVDIPTNNEAAFYYGFDTPRYSDSTKDNHSYNVSIGMDFLSNDTVDPNKANRKIVMLENIMASTDARNPLSNSDLTLANNVIYNPDNRGTYLRNEGPSLTPEDAPPTYTNILSNRYKAGPLSGGLTPVYFGEGLNGGGPDDTLVTASRVFMSGNVDTFGPAEFYFDEVEATHPHVAGATQNAWTNWGLQLMGAEHLIGYLVPRVGADYRYRTANENKVFDDVEDSTNTVSTVTTTLMKSVTNTTLPNAGGFPSITYTKRTFTDLPADPNGDSDADGWSNLEEWIYVNYTLKAEYQLNTILHGSWEHENYPWMMDTFTQIEKRLAHQ